MLFVVAPGFASSKLRYFLQLFAAQTRLAFKPFAIKIIAACADITRATILIRLKKRDFQRLDDLIWLVELHR